MFIWQVVKDGWDLVEDGQIWGQIRLLGEVVEVTSWTASRHDRVTSYPADAFGGGLTIEECQYQVVAELMYDATERAGEDRGEATRCAARTKLENLQALLFEMARQQEKDASFSCHCPF